MKRINKFSKNEEIDFVFDLINVIVLANNSDKASFLLQELFSPYEIRNLSKRLRIAKLILEGNTHEQITDEMHCSYATIAKINTWLEQSGKLKDIIIKLPKMQKKVNIAGYRFRAYRLPEAIWESYLNAKSFDQKQRVTNLLKNTKTKQEIFDKIQSYIYDYYKEKSIMA